jgi:protein TonB
VAVLVVSLVASDTLPTPRRGLIYTGPRIVEIVDVDLPTPPPRARGAASAPVPIAASSGAAPVVAPDGIGPETGLEATAPGPDRSGLAVVENAGGSVDGVGLIEAPPAPPLAPVRLHSGIRAPQKVAAPPPVDPPAARLARGEGIVILEAVIDASGRVEAVRVLRSVGLLDQAAIEAVREWQFTPAQLNGTAIPVVMTVTVSFKLQP